MPKKLYTSVPPRYEVCLHADCPKADVCLHQIAYQKLLSEQTFLHIINPKMCKKNARCPFYRNSTPIRYARGFTNFQKHMYPDQYAAFSSMLKSEFGRNPYYERRKGISPLSLAEQDLILNALQRVGVKEKLEFDAYEDEINWYD